MEGDSRKLVRDYGGTTVVAVLVALVIRFFIIEAYRIPSAAMRPTLEPGDTIFVAKWPFGLRLPWSADPIAVGRMPTHGEVVVFSPPNQPKHDYIKRVIGLPGDVVTVHQGKVSLNGKPLEQGEVSGGNPCGREQFPQGASFPVCREAPLIDDYGPEPVPPGEVFLLGDFRGESATEHAEPARATRLKSWGLFPVSSLKGTALWVWLSIEPRTAGWFPQFRFDRMLRRVE